MSKMMYLSKYIIYSSLNIPFRVISPKGLVKDVPAPKKSEFLQLLQLLKAYVLECEKEKRIVLVDFEGEMLGHCGELSTVAVLETSVLDNDLKRVSVQRDHFPLGLLIDLRTEECINAFRPLMESPGITKLMWGADADCQSLMHQEFPIQLKIEPQAVIDIQLVFSSPGKRLGMAKMLTRLPKESISKLPNKEQIDWHKHHSKNQRALALPMSTEQARYACDDLHRIEAILEYGEPETSYQKARELTENEIAKIKADPCGWASLEKHLSYYLQRAGEEQLSYAVRIARHCKTLTWREKHRGLNLGQEQKEYVKYFEKQPADVLAKAGVAIYANLSFAGDEARHDNLHITFGRKSWADMSEEVMEEETDEEWMSPMHPGFKNLDAAHALRKTYRSKGSERCGCQVPGNKEVPCRWRGKCRNRQECQWCHLCCKNLHKKERKERQQRRVAKG